MPKVTAKKLENAVDEFLLRCLFSIGFVRDLTGGAVRADSSVYHYIAVLVQRIGGVNQVSPFVQVGFEQSGRIYQYFMSPGEPFRRPIDIQVPYCYFTEEWGSFVSCETEGEIPSLLSWLDEFLRTRVLPCIERYSDPHEVLAVYLKHDETNRTPCDLSWTGYSSALTGLILARLHGERQQYNNLRKRYSQFIDPLMPEIKERALKLLAYLEQDELKPL